MPAQNYTKNIAAYYEGQEQFLAHTITNVVSEAAALAAGIDFGRAVQVSGTGVAVGSATGFIKGISLRVNNREAQNRPAARADTIRYERYDTVAVMKHGYLAIRAQDAGNVVKGAAPFVDLITGMFYLASGAGHTDVCTNVRWATAGAGLQVAFISESVLG